MYMLLETKYLGEMEIAEEKIVYFESGIPGFSDEKEFVLLDIPDQDVLQMLQSLHTPNLAFFITNPHHFYADYRFALEESVIKALQIKAERDLAILSIMTVKEPLQQSTINLQAPIIINYRTMLGKQIILKDEQYSMKASIVFSQHEGGE